MDKIRFAGGMYYQNDKERWAIQSEKDGFTGIWPWLMWITRQRIKGNLIMKEPNRINEGDNND